MLTPEPVPVLEVHHLVIFSLAFVTGALLHFVTALSRSFPLLVSAYISIWFDWLMDAELNVPQ